MWNVLVYEHNMLAPQPILLFSSLRRMSVQLCLAVLTGHVKCSGLTPKEALGLNWNAPASVSTTECISAHALGLIELTRRSDNGLPSPST